VEVSPQEKPIPSFVRAPFAIRSNMSCFQSRQCPFQSDCTPPPIDIRHEYSKCALFEARTNEVRLTKAFASLYHARKLQAG